MMVTPETIDKTQEDSGIEGVRFKQLRTFPDDRGFFRELIRETDDFFTAGFAQWSHSKMGIDTVKAWHFHHRQYDWWYVGIGHIKTVLIDNRKDSPSYRKKLEFIMGEGHEQALSVVVCIPPGVLHGCRVLSPEAHLFYITSEVYNPDDEGRIPYDSSEIDHDWGAGELVVADNDKRLFTPPHALNYSPK